MNLGAPEIALIVLAVFILFGYKKLPDATRSLGRSLRIFKGEMKGMQDDGRAAAAPTAPATAPSTAVQAGSPAAAPVARPVLDLEAEAAEAEAVALEARARAARARADAERATLSS